MHEATFLAGQSQLRGATAAQSQRQRRLRASPNQSSLIQRDSNS